jgi:NAD+ synthase (glutamine-hydrolysing)
LNPLDLGFVRAAVASPELRVADVEFNAEATARALAHAAAQGASLALFPELGVTGYTCADLFYQSLLLEKARAALGTIAAATAENHITAVVGLPLLQDGKIYNCAVMLSHGSILGVVPKSYLPTRQEYYEERWFTSARNARFESVEIEGEVVPFGVDLLFRAENLPSCVIGIEICEDLWAINPPSSDKAVAGATILLNPSASDDTLGKSEYRSNLVAHQSARCLGAYLYAGASPNESTTDVVFAGHSLIAEYGRVLAETERFQFATQLVTADIDVDRLTNERTKNESFAAQVPLQKYRSVEFTLPEPHVTSPYVLQRPLSQTPFVPSDPALRAQHCREIFAIQSTGLAKRLKHTGVKSVVIGLSGGLDSTLALLVAIKAFDTVGLDRRNIVAISMPGFGTTIRTKSNSEKLAAQLGIAFRTIPITDAVRQHFDDIGHPQDLHNVVYENAQARERTQVLMDVANQIGGFVVGTGDLSELALGWATFNGDHMSMYHVNAGVPKTLVRYLVDWCAESEFSGEAARVLHDIANTPITPELLPLDDNGALQQETEATIGPYVLHDFFLFYMVRHQFAPKKVFFLAQEAFQGSYDDAAILNWLDTFYRRFFSQQFKRSAMPDGPKVGSVALSPRGDWRMPSDASAALWLDEVKALRAQLEQRAPPAIRLPVHA